MSQSSQEAFSTGAGVADPHAGGDAVAVPGVIRTAAAASRGTQPPIPGYSPKLSVGMAMEHRWASYGDTIRALRSLVLTSLRSARSYEQARDTIARLYGREPPLPFAPELDLYAVTPPPPRPRLSLPRAGSSRVWLTRECVSEYTTAFFFRKSTSLLNEWVCLCLSTSRSGPS